MSRCWLQGSEGDAVLRATGFNVRWLLRVIARQAAKATSLSFSLAALYAAIMASAAMRVMPTGSGRAVAYHPA